MNNVLFIDNDNAVLKSVKRTYKLKTYSYDLCTLNDAKLAFQKFISERVDVVVADIALNDFACKSFFEELAAYDPSIIRISTTANYSLMESFNDEGQTHLTFTKPVNTAHLLDWLEQLFVLKEGSEKELEARFFSKVKLKSYPEHILEIMQMLKKSDFQMEDLSLAINNDTNLRIKLLKFINSSSFGFNRQVTDLKEAIEYLGVTNINNVIRYLNVFSIFEAQTNEIPLLKTVPYLQEKKIIQASLSMDLTFIFNLQDFLSVLDTELDHEIQTKSLSYIMYILMVDTAICEAVRFSIGPELCKIKNQALNAIVLANYLAGNNDEVKFLNQIYGKDKVSKLKKGFSK